MNKKTVIAFLTGAAALLLIAASPSFYSFNTNQFGTSSSSSWIKNGALTTNQSIRGLTIPAGGGTNLGAWNNAGRGSFGSSESTNASLFRGTVDFVGVQTNRAGVYTPGIFSWESILQSSVYFNDVPVANTIVLNSGGADTYFFNQSYFRSSGDSNIFDGPAFFDGAGRFNSSVVLGSSATATTPAEDDNDTSVATTAYVQTEIALLGGGGGTGIATNSGSGTNNLFTRATLNIATNLGAEYLQSTLNVQGTTFANILYATGAVTHLGIVTNVGAAYFQSTLRADGAVTANGISIDNVRSTNGSRFDSTITAGGLTSVDSQRTTNAARFDGAITAGSSVSVGSLVSTGTVATTGATTIGGLTSVDSLRVTNAARHDGTSTFGGAVSVASLTSTGAVAISSTASINGLTSVDSLRVTNGARFDGAITAGSSISAGSLTSTGAVAISGATTIGGAVSVASLTSTGAVAISGAVTVGSSIAASSASITNTLSAAGGVNTSTLVVSNTVQNYASAATIILDCTYSKTHVVTQALASHVSVIVSNYASQGRDFSFFCRGANAATNNNITWSLSGVGTLQWANAVTNTSCLSNGWVFVSGTVPMSNAGMLTNVVLNFVDE